ncbi:DUF3987 domain-containing protein [Marinobacter salinisoli]|uniref:DUF3987 domain-containing protein n=1 Tax=Marinobacter salinisoli TaxID=2769486 RepID=A0ABX7MSE7_9GAMM|nr:YfjI family protein [Marinobacter salinisoli]QSP95074.1 DUF3987 domain-containing protein [Marinobacter salinisoli]
MSKQPPMAIIDPRTNVQTPLPGFDANPIPLTRKAPAPEYPVEALGELLGRAATALAHHVQAPVGMAAQSVLAAASLAVHGHANVQKGGIGISPLSLYFLTIAASGERKSSLDNLAMKPVYDYQKERREEYEFLMAKYRADMEAHEMRHKSIVASYKGHGKKPKPLTHDEQQALASDLAELEKNRPTPPSRPHILMEEPTAEGIYKHFLESLPSGGLFSDEGGGFFSGHGMSDEAKGRTITLLSQLWDGKPITRTRAAAGESGVLAGRRLAAHLMIQPVIADKVLSDRLMMGQGFLARFLVCSDRSLVGSRFLANRPRDERALHDPAINQFWERISELIRQSLPTDEAGEIDPVILPINGAAYDQWTNVHDTIEEQLGPHGEFSVIPGFASKAADNVARIAAVLSYVETGAAPDKEHINRAAEIIQYFLQTMLQRSQEASSGAAEHDAMELADWIKRNGGELHANNFNKLPAAYRKAQTARALLALLVECGHAVVTAIGPNRKPRAWQLVEGDENV